MEVRERLPVYAVPGAEVGRLAAPPPPPELQIGRARDRAEVVTAYGGWMEDLPLAAGLLTAADFPNPARRFLIGRVGAEPVGCALTWHAGGTAYLSGIGVLPSARGRGYGTALTMAAAQAGVAGNRRSPPDLVWMYASDAGSALYAQIGFRQVDVHLQLGP